MLGPLLVTDFLPFWCRKPLLNRLFPPLFLADLSYYLSFSHPPLCPQVRPLGGLLGGTSRLHFVSSSYPQTVFLSPFFADHLFSPPITGTLPSSFDLFSFFCPEADGCLTSQHNREGVHSPRHRLIMAAVSVSGVFVHP